MKSNIIRKIFYVVTVTVFVNCNGFFEKNKEIRYSNNPYEVFCSKLRDLKLTDTVLVSSNIKSFKDASIASEFYNSYGKVFSDPLFLERFEKQNNTKAIKILKNDVSGIVTFQEGKLKTDKILLERLLKEKDFVVFNITPHRNRAAISAEVSIVNPITQKTRIKPYIIGLKHIGWSAHSIDRAELTSKLTDTIFIANGIIKNYALGALTISDFKKRDTTNYVSKKYGSISCGSTTKFSSTIEYLDTLKRVTLSFNSQWYDTDTTRTEEKLTQVKFDKSKVKFSNGIIINKSTKKEVLSHFEEVEANEEHFLLIKKEKVTYTFAFNEEDILTYLDMRFFE